MSDGFRTIDPERIAKHFDAPAAEAAWSARWDAEGLHRYDPTQPREHTFVVDTPPPTVSGTLHIGHVFSYTHTDVIVRQRRMAGQNIFYPMGWDDNGLPTERRVQQHFHVRCDPNLAYEPGLSLPPATAATRKQPPRQVSRPNFIELCSALTAELEQGFLRLWTRLGLSVDWQQEYATIGAHARRTAQASFLDLHAKGWLYTSDAPSLWDVDFQTAVAQAELEDREQDSTFNDIAFGIEGTDREFVIATTRPELLPACVAVATHPDDARYRELVGRRAVTPLFRVPVPILASDRVEPEKGTGILMICTFGDQTDVQWWREHGLPLRQVLARNGRLRPVAFGSAGWDSHDPEAANRAYAELVGKRPEQARARILELLADASSGLPPLRHTRPIRHAVKFFEKGDRPLELIPTRQWFCRLLDKKDRLLAKGAEVRWHPELMAQRFTTWTENLQLDWGISRQRYFGVPFPVWYRLDERGEPDYAAPLLCEPERLPVDPTVDVPTGFDPSTRGQPGGFVAESDVFDTWFTSSLSPQISSHWGLDEARHARLFPADMRPQAHEIIRTWAFYTIAKALAHEDSIPWRDVVISGWVVQRSDDGGKTEKISKSKEQSKARPIPPPHELIETYTADGVRYWAASARLGVDTAFDENTLAQGKRLVTKIWNASKFVLSQTLPPRPQGDDAQALAEWEAHVFASGTLQYASELDRAFLHELRATVETATRSFAAFEFAPALKATEAFFWAFTDHYLELVKVRARSDEPAGASGRVSAVASLRFTLEILLRLFAPVLPYVTEEVWSWIYAGETGHPSIHRAPWPDSRDFTVFRWTEAVFDEVPAPEDPRSFAVAAAALGAIHRAKTSAGVGVGRDLEQVTIVGSAGDLACLRRVLADVTLAGRALSFTLREDDTASEGVFTVEDIVFAPKPTKA